MMAHKPHRYTVSNFIKSTDDDKKITKPEPDYFDDISVDNDTDFCYSSSYEKWFRKPPITNVLSEEAYKRRIFEVFKIIYTTLSKSFGPGGSNTIISSYPSQHITKDGYTILSRMYFSCDDNPIDDAFAIMAKDICGRLNNAVGDGTTTATIATYSIYKNFMERQSDGRLDNAGFKTPKDILRSLDGIKNYLCSELEKVSTPVRTTDMSELFNRIYNVTYIASNGDDTIATNIAEVYRQIGCPALTLAKAPDGETKVVIDIGYKFYLKLADKIYVTSDNQTMDLTCADVIIFETKVNDFIYEEIIKPLAYESVARGRKLIVAASQYDEVVLKRKMRGDIMRYYQKTGDFNIVLTHYLSSSALDKKSIYDFSMLANTTVLDWDDVKIIKKHITEDHNVIGEIFNIDNNPFSPINKRMLKIYATSEDGSRFVHDYAYLPSDDNELIERYIQSGFTSDKQIEDFYNLGYIGECSLGLKESTFNELYYNPDLYQKHVNEARDELASAIDKYTKLATFNLEISRAQKRLYSLGLKVATYYVGGDTEVAVDNMASIIDDCIKAASSAFDNGYVLGCGVDLLGILFKCLSDKNVPSKDKELVDILFEGFVDVYRAMLSNIYEDFSIIDGDNYLNTKDDNVEYYNGYKWDVLGDMYGCSLEDGFKYVGDESSETEPDKDSRDIFNILTNRLGDMTDLLYSRYNRVSLFDAIIFHSITEHKVLDVRRNRFTEDVINSVKTDEEVLKATIDLIGLLITGNQMIVTQTNVNKII